MKKLLNVSQKCAVRHLETKNVLTTELDTGLQVGSHERGVEEQNHLPQPAGHICSPG